MKNETFNPNGLFPDARVCTHIYFLGVRVVAINLKLRKTRRKE